MPGPTVYDMVGETSTTTGTGTITLAGAKTGYRSFSVVGNANTCFYTIRHQTADEFEVGIGTYTVSGTTLSRDKVLASSNSGAKVNFGSGTKDVFLTGPIRLVEDHRTITWATKGLVLEWDTSERVEGSADEVILVDTNNYPKRTLLLDSETCTRVHADINESGISGLDTGSPANSTWYHIWAIAKPTPYVAEPVTADNATELFTLTAHGLAANSPLTLGGTPPTGLSSNTAYYVRDVLANTFGLAATPGGAQLTFTTNGTSVTITEVPALLLSTSASAPTMPSGYQYKAYLGAVYNDSGSSFTTFYQRQKRVWVFQTNVFTAQAGVVSWTSQSVSTIVPTTAKTLHGLCGTSTSNSKGIAVGGDGSGLGMSQNQAATSANTLNSFGGQCGPFEVPMITAQTFYWIATDTNSQYRVDVTGWEYE
jgi:hypothetical protein